MKYIGEKYGNLTIISNVGIINGSTIWLCHCDCGNQVKRQNGILKIGRRSSCDECLIKYRSLLHTKHGSKVGGKKERLYEIWKGMRKRCNNPNSPRYKDYGKRGIKICIEWDNYIIFKEWALNNGYNELLTIERKNNDGDYSPSNCYWATYKEQNNNKRNNKIVTIYRKQLNIADAERLIGTYYGSVNCMRRKIKCTHQQAINIILINKQIGIIANTSCIISNTLQKMAAY